MIAVGKTFGWDTFLHIHEHSTSPRKPVTAQVALGAETELPSGGRSRQRRNSSQRLGYLLAAGQTVAVPCIVRELADDNAVLTMGGWLGVPGTFSLFVEPDGLCVDCSLVSVKGNTIRVSTSNSRQERRPRLRS